MSRHDDRICIADMLSHAKEAVDLLGRQAASNWKTTGHCN